jgi:hypothetical protein
MRTQRGLSTKMQLYGRFGAQDFSLGACDNDFPYICAHSPKKILFVSNMFWTLELASHLEEAPWPATKDELIDYAIRSGAPLEVVENLQELDDEGEIYEGIEDIWPDYPTQEDFFFNEDEY